MDKSTRVKEELFLSLGKCNSIIKFQPRLGENKTKQKVGHWKECCGEDAWILQILHLKSDQGILWGSYLLQWSQTSIACLFLRLFSPSPDLFSSHSPLKPRFSQRADGNQPFTHPEPSRSWRNWVNGDSPCCLTPALQAAQQGWCRHPCLERTGSISKRLIPACYWGQAMFATDVRTHWQKWHGAAILRFPRSSFCSCLLRMWVLVTLTVGDICVLHTYTHTVCYVYGLLIPKVTFGSHCWTGSLTNA